MSKKHKGGDHGDVHADERWLITYADMITLLLAVFIVMYALSDTNLRKFNAFAQSLSSAFSNDVMAGSTQFTVTEGQATSPDNGNKAPGVGYLGSEAETMKATVKNMVIQKGLDTKVSISTSENGLSLHFDANLLFQPGRATLDDSSAAFLKDIADMVATASSKVPTAMVTVVGNTDSTPVSGPFYADNWELSAARALTVLHFLAQNGTDPNRLVMAGNGANMPLPGVPTDSAANRRVEIDLVIPAATASPSPSAPVESIAPSFNPVFGG
jgi:chemotaxis protein MotB